MLGVSALYHVGRWSQPIKRLMRRVDHSTISVLIAGTLTPFAIGLHSRLGYGALATAWVMGLIVVLLNMVRNRVPRWVEPALYLAQSWGLTLILFDEVLEAFGWVTAALVAAGGVIYTVGYAAFAICWPRPVARVFGYHELWHVMTLAGAGLHFSAVLRVISTL
jgi:hemolysin III